MEIFPGGTGVFVYKYNQKNIAQIYLPAEDKLLDNVFKEEVQINQVLMDCSLIGLFVAYIGLDPEKDTIATQECITGSVQSCVADFEGPGVLF